MVSAQGANADGFSVNWFHPLLYAKTLGQKERTITEPDGSPKGFERTTIFRPGMLQRLVGDRTAENILNAVFGWMSLRVDDLAKAMVLEAETPYAASFFSPLSLPAVIVACLWVICGRRMYFSRSRYIWGRRDGGNRGIIVSGNSTIRERSQGKL